jgi:peptidoglycan/LPS O-acetylase OafA/YrhL
MTQLAEPPVVAPERHEAVHKPVGTVAETGSHFTPDDGGPTYAESRRTRVQRRRIVGLLLCVPIWVASIVPLARLSLEGREGMDAALVYLVVAALSLGVAAAIRGIFVWRRQWHFWAPSMFLIAAFIALAGYTIQSGGEEVPAVPVAAAAESIVE